MTNSFIDPSDKEILSKDNGNLKLAVSSYAITVFYFFAFISRITVP